MATPLSSKRERDEDKEPPLDNSRKKFKTSDIDLDIPDLILLDEISVTNTFTSPAEEEMKYDAFRLLVADKIPDFRLSYAHRAAEIAWQFSTELLQVPSRAPINAVVTACAALKRLVDIKMCTASEINCMDSELFGFLINTLNKPNFQSVHTCQLFETMLQPVTQTILDIGNDWLNSARLPTVFLSELSDYAPETLAAKTFEHLSSDILVKHVEVTSALLWDKFRASMAKVQEKDKLTILLRVHLGSKPVGTSSLIVEVGAKHSKAREAVITLLTSHQEAIHAIYVATDLYREYNVSMFDKLTGPGAWAVI